MSQWHIPPDHIVNRWSESLLLLMLEKMSERLTAQADAAKVATQPQEPKPIQITARDLRGLRDKQDGNQTL